MRRPRSLLLVLPLLTASCDAVVLFPSGDVALQQRNLLVLATALMLLIIVPVIAMCLWFAWKYREDGEAAYDPEWDHSTKLELGIWTAPLLIIICLGAATWVGTHLLDPYRPVSRIAAGTPVPEDEAPLEVQVVALDWKWLFVYPQYGVATLNELYVPRDRPLAFHLTANSVMNAFYVPAMAGMIYAMPGMETDLHAVMNEEGVYDGFASHYNGAGFSGMHFDLHTVGDDAFESYIDRVRRQGMPLDRSRYLDLAAPGETSDVRYYASVTDGLYDAIVGMCVAEGKMCRDEMMAIDRRGGAGTESHANRDRLVYDAHPLGAYEPGEDQGATAPATSRPPHSDFQNHGAHTPQTPEGAGGVVPDQLNEAR